MCSSFDTIAMAASSIDPWTPRTRESGELYNMNQEDNDAGGRNVLPPQLPSSTEGGFGDTKRKHPELSANCHPSSLGSHRQGTSNSSQESAAARAAARAESSGSFERLACIITRNESHSPAWPDGCTHDL